MDSESANVAKEERFHVYPFYSPRFWHGMRPAIWWSLLRSGRFRVSWARLPLFVSISLSTPINTVLGVGQKLIYRCRLAQDELHGPPVFIIGHWRSGTTLLHELMVRDDRYSSPSTFQCFAPHHFLLSEWFFRQFFSWLLPGKRPMDNMAAGWDRPQEDEFALMNLGMPSPYRRIAFPRQPPPHLDYLDLESVGKEEQQRWLSTLRRFLVSVGEATGRPLIIKSPTHTGRIAQLAEEFPDAKFIHLTRDPRALYPSTCRLWRSLDQAQSLQRSSENGYGDYVIECLRRMYDAFHRDRHLLPPSRLIDVRYEDLIARPVETLEQIYDTLHLADFESVRPNIQQWAENEHRGYQANQHQLNPDDETRIREAWRGYFERYGYTE